MKQRRTNGDNGVAWSRDELIVLHGAEANQWRQWCCMEQIRANCVAWSREEPMVPMGCMEQRRANCIAFSRDELIVLRGAETN